ncbi:MAG TPA: hypothetical protein VN622_13980 [Clostridia bacterium]|nr:hypothetical protein [Clostridia bacterium]
MVSRFSSQVTTSQVDFDVHGIVCLRLIDALPQDVSAVTRQIGPLQTSALDREPDIVIRYVDEIPIKDLCHVTYQGSGYTPDGFFILRSGRRATRVRIDFSQIGGRCKILCQRGLGPVPMLIGIVTMTALSKGFVPLHGSAFVHDGTGVIVTGWSKGGKTEALLSFSNHGARYVGDEWILLSSDGRNVYGVPENIRLWEWHLQNLPHLLERVSREDRWLFRAIHSLEWLSSHALQRRFPWTALHNAMPALKRQLNVVLPAQVIFGEQTGPFSAEPRKLFFMVSHESQHIEVEPADPVAIARRMSSSVRYEQLVLMSAYLEFKFAFPEKRNEFLENAHELEHDLLCRALAGKEAYTVKHPYPVRFDELYRAMIPCLASSTVKSYSAY